MNDTTTTVNVIRLAVQKLVSDRDWEQFHNGKNLSMNIAIEAGELMEHFLWANDKEVATVMDTNKQEIEHEIADIAISLLCLCNTYNIDLSTIITRKLDLIAQKYPIEKAKGRKVKYDKL